MPLRCRRVLPRALMGALVSACGGPTPSSRLEPRASASVGAHAAELLPVEVSVERDHQGEITAAAFRSDGDVVAFATGGEIRVYGVNDNLGRFDGDPTSLARVRTRSPDFVKVASSPP